MLAIVEPDDLDEVLAICARWEVRATVIGTVTGTGRLRVLDRSRAARCSPTCPATSLDDDAPLYDRPRAAPADLAAPPGRRRRPPAGTRRRAAPTCSAMLVRHRRGCGRQYDHQLFLNTVEGPGGDAAVLRLKHPDHRRRHRPGPGPHHRRQPPVVRRRPAEPARRWWWPRRCSTSPASAPARSPLVNCLNFGNPEHPEVMWQLSEAIDGMAEALPGPRHARSSAATSASTTRAAARDIDPTPVVGVLGLVDALDRRRPASRLVDGGRLLLVGRDRRRAGRFAAGPGQPRPPGRARCPPSTSRRSHDRGAGRASLVGAGLVPAPTTCRRGGLGLALAEMAVALRASASPLPASTTTPHLFRESAGRAVLCVDPEQLTRGARGARRPRRAGSSASECAGGDRLKVKGPARRGARGCDRHLHPATARRARRRHHPGPTERSSAPVRRGGDRRSVRTEPVGPAARRQPPDRADRLVPRAATTADAFCSGWRT